MRRFHFFGLGVVAVLGQFLLSLTVTEALVTLRRITLHPTSTYLRSSSSSALSSSYNPNDGESPEERRARMELVRKIQANFYQPDETTTTAATKNDDMNIGNNNIDGARWLSRDPNDASLLYNVPLWRVQWTELPGYQNVLNVHVAHYTHMFRKLVLQHPKPWLFGHVFLPGGSENLANPDYFLPKREASDDNDNDPLPHDELERLRKVPVTGTLMQITDYSEQEDGRLALVVQGVGRIKIVAASQQVPYAIASKVQILSDVECWEPLCSRLVGTAPTDLDLSMAYMDAARAVAAKESELLLDLEFHQTIMEQKTINSDGDVMISGVSPLSNVNGSVAVDFGELKVQLQEALSTHLSKRAEECGRDDVLLASTTSQLSDNIWVSAEEDVISDERELWIKLDEMIHLLGKVQPGLRIPVPAQLLGLLPMDIDWPKGFRLHEYADKLEDHQAEIGTYSKSPFVRLSKAYPEYPLIRRASRLSFTVWLLIDGIAAIGGGRFSKEEYLNTLHVKDRLRNTIQYLDLINKTIEGMIGS